MNVLYLYGKYKDIDSTIESIRSSLPETTETLRLRVVPSMLNQSAKADNVKYKKQALELLHYFIKLFDIDVDVVGDKWYWSNLNVAKSMLKVKDIDYWKKIIDAIYNDEKQNDVDNLSFVRYISTKYKKRIASTYKDNWWEDV